jgi:hypothetical protein
MQTVWYVNLEGLMAPVGYVTLEVLDSCSGSEDSDSPRIALTVHDWIAVYYDSFYVFITPPESRTIRNPFLPR